MIASRFGAEGFATRPATATLGGDTTFPGAVETSTVAFECVGPNRSSVAQRRFSRRGAGVVVVVMIASGCDALVDDRAHPSRDGERADAKPHRASSPSDELGQSTGARLPSESRARPSDPSDEDRWVESESTGDASRGDSAQIERERRKATSRLERLALRALIDDGEFVPEGRDPASGLLEYRHVATGIRMVYLAGGLCEVGAPEGECGATFYEFPRHCVFLDPFLIGKYEVTQADWIRRMGTNPSRTVGDELPVDSVSWLDCIEFCTRTGLSLPTEAEWEYACRAGTSTPFSSGDCLDARSANYDGKLPYCSLGTEADAKRCSGGPARGRPVAAVPREGDANGLFLPNAFGLFHMHGNVWELCEDRFNEEFYGALEPGSRTPLPADGWGGRVARGGSWFDRADYCRSASRNSFVDDLGSFNVGLRVVRPLLPDDSDGGGLTEGRQVQPQPSSARD